MDETQCEGRRGVALVTGASSGIGRALTRRFAADGFDLVLVARSTDVLAALAAELEAAHGITATPLTQDLAVDGAATSVLERLDKREIDVDLLVNNAGFQVYGPIQATDPAKQLALIHVNVIALVDLTMRLLPAMIERGRGRILNVASTAAFGPGPLDSVYAASKAFVLSFSRAIASDLRYTGVTVTALCPGATRTRFAERSDVEETRSFKYFAMDVEPVADAGYRALMQGKTVVVPGLLNKLETFIQRFLPRPVETAGARWLMEETS
jgi:hypothetical protein